MDETTILIVDDTKENLVILMGLLDDFDILVAPDGETAVELAQEEDVDLILLDIMMPGLNGFEVSKILSQDERTKQIPIIFVTSKTDEDDIKEAFESGGVDYITKPVKKSEVLARIKTHLELKRHRDNLEALVAEKTVRIRQKNEEIQNKNLELEIAIATVEQRNQEIEAERKKVEAANQAKTNFLRNIHHELRTPMSGIIGFNNLMLAEDLDDTLKEYAEIVNTSANALLTIIGDILHFTEMEHGEFKLDSLPLNPRSIVQDIHNLFAVKAKEKQIILSCTVDETFPQYLTGDPGRLRQILFIIVGNAVKFTKQGKITLSMKYDASGTNPVLVCEVRDTGIGIPEKERDKLFEPFFQVDESCTRIHGGIGLGLANAKRMIEMMNGEISLESKPGEGTSVKFSVTLSF